MSEKKHIPMWARVARAHAGKTTTPTVVARQYKTDRAYACRVLQLLVSKGLAKQKTVRGPYYIYAASLSREY